MPKFVIFLLVGIGTSISNTAIYLCLIYIIAFTFFWGGGGQPFGVFFFLGGGGLLAGSEPGNGPNPKLE